MRSARAPSTTECDARVAERPNHGLEDPNSLMPHSDKPWRPFLVLVASDSDLGARSLESVLASSGYAVMTADDGLRALELARAEHPDAIIVDAKTPELPGLDVCRRLRGDPRFDAMTPIIFTTSHGSSRDERLDAYTAGAWDMCAQPIDGAALLLKLQTFLRAKRECERTAAGSLVDGATRLYNAEGLRVRARELGADAMRRREPLAFVAFSADTGDDGAEPDAGTVQRLIDACRSAARGSDVFGRLSRSELACIAPSTDAQGAAHMIGRMQARLANGGSDLPAIEIRAGYCATPNFAESTLGAVDMLLRAATALQNQRMAPRGGSPGPQDELGPPSA
jgi:PleD family two-component response regulator